MSDAPAKQPDAVALPHFAVPEAPFEPMPQYGGSQAVLYRSPDGRRIAGTFRESGSHTLTMAYDEFIFVVAGGVALTVHGGERHDLTAGDACYLREGQTVDFEMSDDFQDIAVLISDTPITY